MATVFLDAVFKQFFFLIVPDTGQQLTIDRTNFLTDGCLQIIQRTGFVSVNTRFQIPPKEKKSHVERSGQRGGHGTSPKREMRCSGNMFRTMVIDWFALCAVAPSCLKVTNQEEKNADHLVPPLGLSTHSKDFRFPWVTLYKGLSPYRAVNTLHVGYKNQAVNVV